MLDIQPLYYSFDDPVDVGQFLQVIFDVAYGHQAGSAFAIECSRFCFESPLQAHSRHLVAVFAAMRRYNIKPQAGDTNVGKMCGNGSSHHAGAQYRGPTNPLGPSYAIL